MHNIDISLGEAIVNNKPLYYMKSTPQAVNGCPVDGRNCDSCQCVHAGHTIQLQTCRGRTQSLPFYECVLPYPESLSDDCYSNFKTCISLPLCF